MALNETIPKIVAFVVGVRKRGGASVQIPIGTSFFVGVRTLLPPEQITRSLTLYLVTAAHVVRAEPETWVRLRRMNGGLEDIRVREWMFHDHDDVAVTVMDLDDAASPYDMAVLPIPDFLPSYAEDRYRYSGPRVRFRPMLGDRVYFPGLFSPVSAMGEQNIPLLRAGTLAAFAQERVPVRTPDGTTVHYTAHLIDSRSYAGFSGSPCFVQFPISPGIGGVGRPNEETELLGVVSSHFDFKENASITGDFADQLTVGVPVHLGVSVVMPAESIAQLLDREDIMNDRKARERGYVKPDADPAATPNVVGDDDAA